MLEPIDPHHWEAELRRYGDPRLGGLFVARSDTRPALFRLGCGGCRGARESLSGRLKLLCDRPDPLGPWTPVWIRALPGRTPQEIAHALEALRQALGAEHDFLPDGVFVRRPADAAPQVLACAESFAAQALAICLLGPADDRRLRRRVHDALRRARGRPRLMAWLDLGGNQPIIRREWWFDGRRLLLESEAHAGLRLCGPPDLIGRVTKLLGATAT